MKKFLAAALLAGTAIAPASAATVNFADFGGGTAMTNQVAGVSFALSGGPGANGAPVVGYGWYDSVLSLNNSQVYAPGGYAYPTSQYLTIDFANGAKDVSFTFNNYGVNGANYKAYGAGDVLISSGDIGSVNSFGLVNVVGEGITKLVLDNSYGANGDWVFGVGKLNFTAGAVPEPGTWAMMLAGIAIVGASMRRRQTAISFA